MRRTNLSDQRSRVLSILIFLSVFCGVFFFGYSLLVGRVGFINDATMILTVGNGSSSMDKRGANNETEPTIPEESVATPTARVSDQPFQNHVLPLSIPSAGPQTTAQMKPTEMLKSKHIHHLPMFNRSCSFRTFTNYSGIHIRKFMGDEEKQYFHGMCVCVADSQLPIPRRTVPFPSPWCS